MWTDVITLWFCECVQDVKKKKKSATECRNFELSVAADRAELDFINKMPFRMTPNQGSY